MNTELKNIIDSVFNAKSVVSDVIGKSYASLVIDAIKLCGDVPRDVSGASDLENEIKALEIPANLADIASYLSGKLAGTASASKVSAVITSLVSLITQAIALEQAIVS